MSTSNYAEAFLEARNAHRELDSFKKKIRDMENEMGKELEKLEKLENTIKTMEGVGGGMEGEFEDRDSIVRHVENAIKTNDVPFLNSIVEHKKISDNIEYSRKMLNSAIEEFKLLEYDSVNRLYEKNKEHIRVYNERYNTVQEETPKDVYLCEIARKIQSAQKKKSKITLKDMNFDSTFSIRHSARKTKSVWNALYDPLQNAIVREEKMYKNPTSFCMDHYKVERPERKSCNGWSECELLVDGEWIPFDVFRLLFTKQ
jgi:hypothetical protein